LIKVGDRVSFNHKKRTFTGYVHNKNRKGDFFIVVKFFKKNSKKLTTKHFNKKEHELILSSAKGASLNFQLKED